MLLNISADIEDKGGKEDLEKAKHYIDMIIERDYSDEPNLRPLPPWFYLKGKEIMTSSFI